MNLASKSDTSGQGNRGITTAALIGATIVSLFALFLAGGVYLFSTIDSESKAKAEQEELGALDQISAPTTPTATPTPQPTAVPTPEVDAKSVSFISSDGNIAIGRYSPDTATTGDELTSFYDAKENGAGALKARWINPATLAILTSDGNVVEQAINGEQLHIWDVTEPDSTQRRVVTFTVVDAESRSYALALDTGELILAEYNNTETQGSSATSGAVEPTVTYSTLLEKSEDPRVIVDMAFAQNHIAIVLQSGVVEAIDIDSLEVTNIWPSSQHRAALISASPQGFLIGVGHGYIANYNFVAETEPMELVWDATLNRPNAVAFSTPKPRTQTTQRAAETAADGPTDADISASTVVVTVDGSVTTPELWGDGTDPVLLWDVETFRIKAVGVDSDAETAIVLLTNGAIVKLDLTRSVEPTVVYEPGSAFGRFALIDILKD